MQLVFSFSIHNNIRKNYIYFKLILIIKSPQQPWKTRQPRIEPQEWSSNLRDGIDQLHIYSCQNPQKMTPRKASHNKNLFPFCMFSKSKGCYGGNVTMYWLGVISILLYCHTLPVRCLMVVPRGVALVHRECQSFCTVLHETNKWTHHLERTEDKTEWKITRSTEHRWNLPALSSPATAPKTG